MENGPFVSAIRLYEYIFRNFWNGRGVVGSSPGLNLDIRLLRYVKSYLPFLRWAENHYFLQAQGYWTKSNWELFDATGHVEYKEVAMACSKEVLRRQRDDGSWEYPLKAWKKYASTVEGTWASLGLIETFKCTKESAYLEGALKWYDFLINKTGFQTYKGSLAINYFDVPTYRVPNNTTLVLWFLAELYGIEEDPTYLRFNDGMIKFIQLSQSSNGEIRYSVSREHYLCFHYNAFEFLDLYYCCQIINDKRMKDILEKLAKFLSRGVTETGSVKNNCSQTFPEVILYSSVVGAALTCAASMDFQGYTRHIDLAYEFLLKNQRPDGSFIYCRHGAPYLMKPISHGFLTDRNPYARPLSYILQHLLIKVRSDRLKSALTAC